MRRRLIYISITMNLNMSIIDDNRELDGILESRNLNEYELINLPMEQPDDLLHKHTCIDIRMAPTLDTGSVLGLAHCEGSSMVLCLGVDPCLGVFSGSPSLTDSYMRHEKRQEKFTVLKFFAMNFEAFNFRSFLQPQ